MNRDRREISITVLHWVLGIALIFGSWLEASHAREAMHMTRGVPAAALAHAGPPAWLRMMIAVSELFAAVAFLIPATVRLGALALLAVLGLATLVHLVHGWNPLSLVAYMAAVFVVYAHQGGGRGGEGGGAFGWPFDDK